MEIPKRTLCLVHTKITLKWSHFEQTENKKKEPFLCRNFVITRPKSKSNLDLCGQQFRKL